VMGLPYGVSKGLLLWWCLLLVWVVSAGVLLQQCVMHVLLTENVVTSLVPWGCGWLHPWPCGAAGLVRVCAFLLSGMVL
jgi:hypothetical protein